MCRVLRVLPIFYAKKMAYVDFGQNLSGGVA